MPASLRKHGRQGRLEADPDEAHNASSEQSSSLAADDQPSRPSRRSLRGLDWFVFFLADTQMGFGPLVAVYLTAQKWTQGDIGLVLTAGGLIALAGQMPGGAPVDAARSERVLAACAVLAIGASAFLIGAWPVFTVVLAAKLLHSAASCILGPAIAALSLGLVGHSAIAESLVAMHASLPLARGSLPRGWARPVISFRTKPSFSLPLRSACRHSLRSG